MKPSTYVPQSDPLLMQRVNDIARAAQHEGLSSALYLTITAIARSVFIDIPYHLVVGTFNAVNIFSNQPIVVHYQDALMHLVFSTLAVIYSVMGILNTGAYDAFRIVTEGGQQVEHREEDINPRAAIEAQLLQLQQQAEEYIGYNHDALAIQLAASHPVEKRTLLELYVQCITGLRSACSQGAQEVRQRIELGGQRFEIHFNFTNLQEAECVLRTCAQALSWIERLSNGQSSLWEFQRLQGQPVERLQIEEHPMEDWTENLNDDFIHVSGPILPAVGVYEQELYGEHGAQLRLMGYRVVLDEYKRLLQSDFGLDLIELLAEIDSWLPSDSVERLRNVIVILAYPDPEGGGYQEAEGQYKAFVTHQRKLIETYRQDTQLSPELAARIRELSYALAIVRFSANIQGYQEDFVNQHIQPHEVVTPHNFHSVFVERCQDITRCDSNMKMHPQQTRWRQMYGALSWLDFLSEPDVPHMRGMAHWQSANGDVRRIVHLRHATPHVSGAIIAPEYKEFLRAQEAKQEGVLYTSYQRLNDTGQLENENSRCQTLIALEEEHPNFYVLFHSVESTLYKNVKKTFVELKTALIASFYADHDPNANRLPRCLQQDPSYRQVMEALFDQVHTLFFDGREEVDPTPTDCFGDLKDSQKVCEWQECMMLFYYFQREDLKFRLSLPITVEVNPCKDNFDRGGGQNMILDRMRHHQVFGRGVPAEVLKATLANVQAPPLMGKGLSVIPKRINPALVISSRLAGLCPEKMGALQQMQFNGWRLKEIGMAKIRGQHAVFSIADARTSREVAQCIQSISGSHRVVQHTMVEANALRFPTQESVFRQLSTMFSRSYIVVNGVHYTGKVGVLGYHYNAQGLWNYLRDVFQLEEARVCRIMSQLDIQIFTDPMQGLKRSFERPDLGLLVTQKHQSRSNIVIQLDTSDEVFVVTGSAKMQLVDITKNGEVLAVFDTHVRLEIPRVSGALEKGEWKWSVLP